MPPFKLLSLLFIIAILDSVNPSAIAVTLIQLTRPRRPIVQALAYILGIFITYFIFGIVLLLGYKYFVDSIKLDFSFFNNFANQFPSWPQFLQIFIGSILIIYSLFFFTQKVENSSESTYKPDSQTHHNLALKSFALGITITGVEAGTAIPYFGAISTIYFYNLSTFYNFLLIFLYCLLFVLPPLAIVGVYILFRGKFESTNKLVHNFLRYYARPILKYSLVFVGVLLIFSGLLYISEIKLF